MASDRQISQLVLQVDANIAVAQRSLSDLARTVNQTTGQMNTALGSTSMAHGKLNQAFNQSRLAQMELSHVMTASVDAYAAGASPLRILTLEMGRVAQAASFMGGGSGIMGKLGAFMSGPWGIAVLLATTVLGQLISKLGAGETSVADLVEKMREHAKEAEKSKLADEAWAHSIDGLIERNEKLVESLQKRLKAEEDISLQELQGAKRDEATAQKAVADAQTKLNNLLRQQATSGKGVSIGQGGSPTGASSALSGQITQARAELATALQAVGQARAAIEQSTISVGEEQGKALANSSANVDLWSRRYISALHGIENANGGKLASSTQTLTAAFEGLKKAMGNAASTAESLKDDGKNNSALTSALASAREKAKDFGNELSSGKLTAAQYATAMGKLATNLQAVATAAKEAKKGAGEFGKQISFADAESIAKSAGFNVTSGYRSEAKQAELYNTVRTAANPVARPGTSAHEGANGKWALDIAFAPGLTPQKIRKVYGDQGVSLSAIYKESGHFHIEGSRSQAAKEENAAARAAQKATTDDDAFARESAQLDAEILGTKKQLAAGFDTQASISDDEIDAQKKALLSAIQKQQDGHSLTDKQADALRLQVEDLTTARKAIIAHQKYVDNLESLAEAQKQETDFQISDLKFADEMAKTQGEHRKLQLAILDIQYKQKEADLERLLATIQSNKDFATSADLQRQAMEVQGQIARLPIERAQDQTRVQQGTMDPLQQYFSNLPHTAAQINQSLKSIEADGIQGLANALSHVGQGWGAMRDLAIQALQDIAQKLIQLGIEKMLFNILGGAVLGGGGGGGGILSTAGGASVSSGYAGLDGIGSLFGGARAGGGPVEGGKAYIVGENRPELFVPSVAGTIMPTVPRIGPPKAANSTTPRGGDTFNISVIAPNTGDPVKDRQTSMQHAAVIEARLAGRRRKGL